MKDSLGDRMKYYERLSEQQLMKNMPVAVRLDGRAFHTFTRGMKKPFDLDMINAMSNTTEYIINNFQAVKIAYVQSDEITLILWDGDTIETDAPFSYRKSKLESILASMAAVQMSIAFNRPCEFDARSWNIPIHEVRNVLLWRHKDWEKNSVQMYARSEFSHNELHRKSQADMHEMLHQKGLNWANLDDVYKNGTWFYKLPEKPFIKDHEKRISEDIQVLVKDCLVSDYIY